MEDLPAQLIRLQVPQRVVGIAEAEDEQEQRFQPPDLVGRQAEVLQSGDEQRAGMIEAGGRVDLVGAAQRCRQRAVGRLAQRGAGGLADGDVGLLGADAVT